MERTFDWKPNHDERSRMFGISTATPSVRTSRYWQTYGTLDQGAEGACVGHGVTGALMTPPNRINLPNPQQTAFGMYFGSRRIDEWEGEDYDGTSVNAGMKLARELGLLTSWRWCFGAADLKQAILEEGPVVIGVWWYESMYDTDPSGLVKIGGEIVGGHCLLVNGYSENRLVGDYKGPVFRWKNSWGNLYGVQYGQGFVPYDTMAQLLAQDGECAIPKLDRSLP